MSNYTRVSLAKAHPRDSTQAYITSFIKPAALSGIGEDGMQPIRRWQILLDEWNVGESVTPSMERWKCFCIQKVEFPLPQTLTPAQ